jgi:hypothetical protein
MSGNRRCRDGETLAMRSLYSVRIRLKSACVPVTPDFAQAEDDTLDEGALSLRQQRRLSGRAEVKFARRRDELTAEMKQWSGPELNRRHMDFQSIALPTELPDRPAAMQSGHVCSRLGDRF